MVQALRAGWRMLLACALLLAGTGLSAQNLQPVPALAGHVVDQTATLTPAEREALEGKLAAFERERGSQLVVLMVRSTQPEDIAGYANRIANAWKIGRRTVGDGVLVIVAKDDRKVRIEVAKTLEGAVPDLAARQIIDEAVTPAFRAGNYAAGLQAASDRLIGRITGEALPAPEATVGAAPDRRSGFQWTDIAIFLFIAVPFAAAMARAVLGRKLGAVAVAGGAGGLALLTSASVAVAVVAGVAALFWALFSGALLPGRSTRSASPWQRSARWGSGGWAAGSAMGAGASDSWSSGSSDSFSSGGGGDFGGGGASGDW